METVEGITCIYCRKPIQYKIQVNKTPSGFMHNDCFAKYDERITRFHDAIDNASKLTEFEVTLRTDRLQEDGRLKKIEDFSDEEFYRTIQAHMVKTNAEQFEMELSLTFSGKSTGYKAKLVVTRKGNKFKYRYKGTGLIAYGYLRPMLTLRQTIKGVFLYYTNRKFRLRLQQDLRQLFWKSMPDWY